MPTIRQKMAFKKLMENNGKSVSKAMKESGYGTTSKNPHLLTESKGFKELLNEYLPEEDLMQVHKQLTLSQRVDHMVFPLGPRDDEHPTLSGGKKKKEKREQTELEPQPNGGSLLRHGEIAERTTLTDKEIVTMLADVNCTVRRIVHGETARHVYFWSPDSKAREKGLDMAYKLRGSYAAEKKYVRVSGFMLGALLTGNYDDADEE